MKIEVQQKIAELIGHTICSKGFKCAESGFEQLCKAFDIGLKDALVCQEDKPEACCFSVPAGAGHLCRCPIRVYLAKELKV